MKQSLFAAENFSDQKESFQRFEYSLLLQVSSGSSITSRLELPGRMLTLPMRISQDTLSKTKLEKKRFAAPYNIYSGQQESNTKMVLCLLFDGSFKAMLFTNKNGTREM